MGQDLALKVVLQAQDSASGQLKGFGSTLINLAGDAGPLLSGLLAISAAAIDIGVQAVQSAANYQAAMNMVQANTGASLSQMQQYDAQLKQLAITAGVAPTALASGLYNVLSAGYQGSQAMQVLTLATKDAKIGMTDATTTTNALTIALKAFNVPASDFDAVNGQMLRTVTAGKMTMADYASAISKTSSVAVQYNDSMSDMNAILATLTASGIKNANVAGTDYNNLLKVLNGNTKSVADASKALNPEFDENAFAAMNVHDKVMYLNSMIVEHGHNITEVIGKQQNAAAAFTVLAGHADVYSNNLKNLSDAQANAKATQDAWAITQSGFNVQLDKAGASVQVLFIDIGQNLLPVLTKLVSGIAPAVQWLINFGKAVSQNQVAVDFIIGGLVGFAALIIMLLVPAFIAWATAAWAAAIATLAATWPFILAAVIIAAVVAVIILAVQHWGQIVDWLKTAWSDIVGFFQMIWNGILISLRLLAQFFENIWNGIRNGVGNFFSALGSLVHNALTALWNAFLKPFQDIGALFVWLYNHNYYFKALIDGIRMIISAGLAWIQMAWNAAITWLVNLWKTVSGFATEAWNAVVATITMVVMAIIVWLTAQWTNITNWLSQQWGKFSGMMSDAWNKVSGVISGAWNTYISGPIGDLWNKLSGMVGGWKDKFFDFGKNMIQGIIDGIKSMVGAAGNAANDVMNNIKQFLGFHSPAEKGEGQHIIEWGSNMVAGFNQGILQSIPTLQGVLSLAMQQGTLPLSPPALASGYGYGQPPISSNYSSNSYANAGGTHYYGGNTVVVQGANQSTDDIAKAVIKQMNFMYRRSGAQTPFTSGGKVW